MAFVTVLNVNGLSLSRSGDYKHPALQASNGSFVLKIQKKKKKKLRPTHSEMDISYLI